MAQQRTGAAELSLSKALKVRSRLQGRLAQIDSNITMYNCTVEGRRGEVDVNKLVEERKQIVTALLTLKTAIYEANRGIQSAIFEVAEKRAFMNLLQGLNTRHGSEPHYQGTEIVYVSALQKEQVMGMVKQLERETDELQDKIDNYNSVPGRVQVPQSVLDLAS